MEEKRNRLLVLLQRLRQIRLRATERLWLDMSYFLLQIFEAYMIAGEEFNIVTGNYGSKGLSLEAGEGTYVDHFFSYRWGLERQHSEVLKFIEECIMSIQQRIIELPYEQDNKH